MIPKYDAKETIKNPINLKTSTVISSDETLEKLGRYIDGAEQTVDYYKLIMKSNDTPTTLDVNLPVTEQQYYLIKDTVIRVITPLEVESLMDLSGEAILPKDIIPNIGDYITMRLLDGSIGIFRVYEIDYKSYNKNKRYTIKYKFDTTNILNSEKYQNLLDKVVKHFNFINSEDVVSGSKILTDNDLEYEQFLKYQLDNLFRIYKDRYLDRETNYFICSHNEEIYYDPYVVELLSYITELDTSINTNIIEDSYIKYLLNPSKVLLKKIKLNYIGRDSIIFIRTTMRLRNILPSKVTYTITSNDGIAELDISGNELFPNIKDIYNLEDNTIFTYMLNEYLDNNIIDRSKLKDMVDYIENNDNVILYWYIPYIILFIKYSLERNYSDIEIK